MGMVQQDTHTDGAEKHRSNYRSVVLPTDSCVVEPMGAKPSAPSNSRKSGTGGEVGLVLFYFGSSLFCSSSIEL